MPRIYTSTSDPIDFCEACFPDLHEAEELYGNLGDGPDDRGNCFEHEAGHPPYDDEDGRYLCETCSKRLTEEDD